MLKQALRAGVLCFFGLFIQSASAATNPGEISNIDQEAKLLSAQAKNLNPDVVKLGLEAYNKAAMQGLVSQQLLTIVDYSLPSTEPRLFVLDLKLHNVVFQELVAHGKNSG